MTKAVLLSGGMDSTCLAYWQRPAYAVTIDYGQRPAAGEVRAAKAVSDALGIEHVVVDANIASLGSGDLAGTPASESAPASEWWPYRNQFLVTVAAMKCHQLGITELMVGALRTDGFHADGTPSFFAAVNELIGQQEGALQVTTPAIHLTAGELVRISETPLEVLGWSLSCHISDIACGFCRGCRKHFEVMGEVFGIPH